MSELLSAESIFGSLSKQIELEWIAGQEAQHLPLYQTTTRQQATIIGHLKLVHKYLRLVVHLERLSETEHAQLDRLHGVRDVRTILGIEIPQVLIPIVPGRNIELLVEAAVRNHNPRYSGNDATQQLINLQQQAINNSSL